MDFSNLIDYKDRPKEFFGKLYKIYLSNFKKDKDEIKNFILNLNKNHNVDICQLSIDAIEDSFSVFDIIDIISESFPELYFNIESLLNLARSFYYKMINDMASYKQYELFKGLVKAQPDTGNKLLDSLLNTNEEFVAGYIAAIYECLSYNDLHNIHKDLILLTERKEEYIIQGIVLTLSVINYDQEKDLKLIELTVDNYENLLNRKSVSLDSSIAWSLKAFIKKIQKAKVLLLNLANKNEPLISFQISRILFGNTPSSIDESFFFKLLFTFDTANCNNLGIINNLDYVLSNLIEKHNTTEEYEKFLKEWIINSDYKKGDVEFGRLWDSTLNSFNGSEERLSRIITILFNSDESVCHRASSEIINYISLHYKKQVKFDAKIVVELDFPDILFICRKVLGYLVSAEVIHPLLFSIVEFRFEEKKVAKLIGEIYLGYLSKDYLITTINLLTKSYQSIENPLLKLSIDSIINDLKLRQEQLNSLPRLNELKISKTKFYRINLEESKKMQRSMKESEKSSLIHQLGIKNIPLRFGSGWFSYVDNDYSEIRKLSLISSSIEMPRTAISQPVASTIMRFGLRIAKRNEE